jgi:DNA-binding MarR family transcriptional regulator
MARMDGGEDTDNVESGGVGDEVRWLTPKERRAWLSIVATHMQLMPALEADLQRGGPVSFFEYQVLAMLSENHGPLPMSELAARTNASLSRLSHVARKLEARNWIRRRPSTEDARVTLAEMTDQGMEEVIRIAPLHVASVRACLLDVLDDEDLEDIGRIGAKILGHLDPGHWVFRDPVLVGEGLTPS